MMLTEETQHTWGFLPQFFCTPSF